MDRFRFDDQCEKVYVYDDYHETYLFFANYYALDIDVGMADSEKLVIAENDWKLTAELGFSSDEG